MTKLFSGYGVVFAAVLLGLTVTAAPGKAEGPQGLLHYTTPHSFETLVEKLDQAVTDNGMFVVTRASASKGAAGRGITIRGDMVVGVYRNDFAVRMLEASVPAGIEAPIRFHIYETADGKANLAYWTPSSVFKPYDGGETLRLMAEELDSIFALIAQQAIAP